jgi:predicted AlkP superfamily phosphohydrolase/phosphomutase
LTFDLYHTFWEFILLKKRRLFPHINKLIEIGATAAYSAYVQKGYKGSYSSEQNWSSIYTGLSPEEHKINYKGNKLFPPTMGEYTGLNPFWEELNKSGLTVGLWAADCLNEPTEIGGYVVSCRYEPIFTPQTNREAPRRISVCKKDEYLLPLLEGPLPPRLYPKTLNQQGFTFEQLKNNPALVDIIANERSFQAMVDNFEEELQFWFSAMRKTQQEHPVDVLYWFTPTTDIVAHFVMYSDDNPVLIKLYRLLDRYIGAFIDEFEPEMTVFMSDHGQQNFKYLINCSDPAIGMEAFSSRDKVIWMPNGYIAFEAQNGGLLFSTHALKGVFIASGNGIRHARIGEMRTVDIYPTLLEMFGVFVPDGRSGYVVDIFEKPIINEVKLLKEDAVQYKRVALIQTSEISVTDIILNELYIENRFARITVVGEARYEEIFRGNPRVSDFLPFEHFDAERFEEVYCGFYNKTAIKHIRVK